MLSETKPSKTGCSVRRPTKHWKIYLNQHLCKSSQKKHKKLEKGRTNESFHNALLLISNILKGKMPEDDLNFFFLINMISDSKEDRSKQTNSIWDSKRKVSNIKERTFKKWGKKYRKMKTKAQLTNLRDTAKVVLTGNGDNIDKSERSQINSWMIHLNILGKQQESKPQSNRWQEIIKITQKLMEREKYQKHWPRVSSL